MAFFFFWLKKLSSKFILRKKLNGAVRVEQSSLRWSIWGWGITSGVKFSYSHYSWEIFARCNIFLKTNNEIYILLPLMSAFSFYSSIKSWLIYLIRQNNVGQKWRKFCPTLFCLIRYRRCSQVEVRCQNCF